MDLPSLLAENIVQGFIIGLLVGLVVRVASKAVRNLLIIQFIVLKYLESRNILIVDWNRMTNGLLGQKDLVIGEAQNLFDTAVEMGIFGAALGRRLPAGSARWQVNGRTRIRTRVFGLEGRSDIQTTLYVQPSGWADHT